MYLQGTLAIDPSQLSQIVHKKPTKAFKKLLYLLTAGAVSDKLEHETFSAISILQQLNTAFRSVGLTNIVHLAKDDVDFYLDEEGRDNDLPEALDAFKLEVDAIEASAFQTLKLVLEHEDEHLKYLIAVQVERVHRPGVYPIHVEVDGLIKRFRAGTNESPQALSSRIALAVPDASAHDHLAYEMQQHFEQFLGSLGLALKSFIGVEDLVQKQKRAIIRPNGVVRERERLPFHAGAARPACFGYAGTADLLLYTMVWSELAHSHSWHISDCSVFDESGSLLMDVGAQGFDASTSAALDPDATFAIPEHADIHLGDSTDIPSGLSSDSSDSSSSWFGGGDGGSWFSSGDSSCSSDTSSCSSDTSSCSSCSSCSSD